MCPKLSPVSSEMQSDEPTTPSKRSAEQLLAMKDDLSPSVAVI